MSTPAETTPIHDQGDAAASLQEPLLPASQDEVYPIAVVKEAAPAVSSSRSVELVDDSITNNNGRFSNDDTTAGRTNRLVHPRLTIFSLGSRLPPT